MKFLLSAAFAAFAVIGASACMPAGSGNSGSVAPNYCVAEDNYLIVLPQSGIFCIPYDHPYWAISNDIARGVAQGCDFPANQVVAYFAPNIRNGRQDGYALDRVVCERSPR